MTDISINAVSRRVQYTGNTGTGPYAFTFNILADADLAVYKDTTLLTLTTDYTVSTNADGTGSITLTTALVSSDVLTILGARLLERTTDFVAGGDFFAASVNEQMDSQVIMAQQLDEKLSRAIKVNPGDEFTDLELPLKADRLGTVLGFNATTGDPEAGPTIADVSSLADITADIATLADIEDGTDATDAIQTVAGISSNVATVAGISGSVSTVAGISSNVTAVAGDAVDIGTVATDITNVNTVAGSIASVNTAAANISDIQNAATNAATATTKAAEAATSAANAATSETNAATSEANAATSETNAAASETAAAASETAAAASETAAATSEANAATSETNAATSETNAATSETNAATSETNAATSETNAATSETNAATSATSAASSATSAASAQTAAETARDQTLSAYDSFDDRYLGTKSSDPTQDNDGNALVAGALYFSSTDGAMKVYTGSAWVAAYASLAGALLVANNLSDLGNASDARSNLGLGAADSPTFNAVTATSFSGDGSALTGIVSIPSGLISLWSGTIANIPSGWVLCDGTNGTPDLTGRFVVHADADSAGTYNVGDTGGSATVSLAEANLPSHTHGTGNYAADSGGAHTHTASSGNSGNHTHTGNTSNTGAHSHNGSTSNTGSHTHAYYRASTFQNGQNNNTTSNRWLDNTIHANQYIEAQNTNTGSAGAHSHNFSTSNTGAHSHSFTTGGGGDHSHSITVNSGGAHTHTISGASGSVGSGTAHENLPPYYALAYIMKT